MDAPDSDGRAGERVVVRNDDERFRTVRVVCRRNGDTRVDAVELSPGDDETLPLPDGSGTVTVELDGDDAGVATTYVPGLHPALFTIRDGSVLVARA